MNILFLGRHYTYFRNFESVLRGLAARGHSIHLAVERGETFGGLNMVEALAAEFPSLTYGEAPARADDDWSWTLNRLRLGLDYLRYQQPVFDSAYTLRNRARGRTPGAFVAFGTVVRRTGGWSRRLASAIVRNVERAVPDDPRIREYLESRKPDIVLLTPLIDLGSSQIEYLRAARALRIPTGLCVWSWDHLSSKALIRDAPDRVFVWNPTQKQEAIALHGVAANRIVVTGAQCFDQWFDRRPSRDRETFCRQVGLPSSPFVLWVCSALFQGSPVEAQFVLKWIHALRNSASTCLREAPILVRPHPSRLAEWQGIDLSGLNAVLWGGNPVDAQSRADYFDSLYHSAAVVGINTSAFIEAGIVGRPVHTIIVPEMESNQTGTVHFNYLLNAGGGLLEVAHSFEEHVTMLDASLARADLKVGPYDDHAELKVGPCDDHAERDRAERKPFVREFVRPNGLDVPATPMFVEHVESMARLKPAAPRRAWFAPLWRSLAERVARARDDERYAEWTLSERELASLQNLREARHAKAVERKKARETAREAHERVRAAEREAKLHARAEERAAKERIRADREAEKARRLAEKRARVDAARAAERQRAG
ncbi:MAG TPA: hypothetical protein VGJ78_05815 [Vicinamibacterales bacterium]|jgi:hypothetical protein